MKATFHRNHHQSGLHGADESRFSPETPSTITSSRRPKRK